MNTFEDEEIDELKERLEGERFMSLKYGKTIEIKNGIIYDGVTPIDDNLSREDLELLVEEMGGAEEIENNLNDNAFFNRDE